MEFSNTSPIYLQIAHQIAERILAGEWKPGERIPSIRDTSSELQVNHNTVMRTYTYLQDQKLIENQRGLGFFVAADGLEQALNLKKTAFVEELLPQVFHHMQVLRMQPEELLELYRQYQNKPDHE